MKRISLRVHAALIAAAIIAALPVAGQGAGLFGRIAQSLPLAANEVLSHMDEAAHDLKTVTAHLTYTTVTVLVNDRAIQTGRLFYRSGKHPEVLVQFSGPSGKEILFKKNQAEIYYRQINQIQEYDLERRRDLLQQFLLLGFGTETAELEASYQVRYLGKKRLGGAMIPVLELTPVQKSVAAQLSKVDLWINPRSWLPVQQEFFEASGDYLIASYSQIQVNEPLASSVFKIRAKRGAEHVKMN
ncbi:MAG: LolA family protein [Terriglobia bacterium]